jgi:hypothetical protein
MQCKSHPPAHLSLSFRGPGATTGTDQSTQTPSSSSTTTWLLTPWCTQPPPACWIPLLSSIYLFCLLPMDWVLLLKALALVLDTQHLMPAAHPTPVAHPLLAVTGAP